MRTSKILQIGLGFLTAGFFLWLISRQTNYHQLVNSLAHVSYIWLVMALICYGLEYVLRISRWKMMLLTQNPILNWRSCSTPLLLSYAINAVLPFRAGDAIRCFSFNARLGVGSGVLLATIFAERILDFLIVLFFFAIALSVFNFKSLPFINIGGFSALSICIPLIAILLFPKLISPLLFIIRQAIAILPSKHRAKFSLAIENGIATLEDLSKSRTMASLIVLSLALWALEGCVFLFAAKASAALVHPEAALLALPVGTLATLIPSTPCYIGTFDYFVSLSLQILGNTNAASLAYAMIIHATLLIPPVLLGAAYLLFGVKR